MCDITRESANQSARAVKSEVITGDGDKSFCDIVMMNPIRVTLFHDEIPRTARYEPLNFLLSYGAQDPFPKILKELELNQDVEAAFFPQLSPLDYFLKFKKEVQGYSMDRLRDIGKASNFPRLTLITEVDFCDIVGQRLAKEITRFAITDYFWSRHGERGGLCRNDQPLSLLFAGPSGNGKTELAEFIVKILNKPQDNAFHKVDCGKVTHMEELFGMSGPYQGAQEGSALNNFIYPMHKEEGSVGVVLLDEIEKAQRDVIHALYNVLDREE